MEASIDEFRPRAGCKEFVCPSKARPEAALCLYLISSFDEVVVSRLSGRARSDRQRMSLIQRFESCGEPKSPRVKQLIDWWYPAFSVEDGDGCRLPDGKNGLHSLFHGFCHYLHEMLVTRW